jgi:hypothetical protein
MTGARVAYGVRVTGQRVLDEHGVGSFSVELATRFVRHGDVAQVTAAFEHKASALVA